MDKLVQKDSVYKSKDSMMPKLEEISKQDFRNLFKKGKYNKGDIQNFVLRLIGNEGTSEVLHNESQCPSQMMPSQLGNMGIGLGQNYQQQQPGELGRAHQNSGEEPYQLVGSAVFDPLDAYKKKVASIINGYFTNGDVDLAASELRGLGSFEYHPYFIKRLVSMAMDRNDKEKEMASVLLSALYSDVITSTHIKQGFFMLLESADDLAIDILDTVEILALFIARAVVDDILPPAFLAKAKKSLSESSKGFQVLQTAEKSYLSAPHHAELVKRGWGGSTHITVEEVKKRISDLLREYTKSGDTFEACRCIRQLGVAFFHHEVVKRALVLSLENRAAEPLIMCLLKEASEEGLISSSQMVKGFTRLRESLDDLALNIPSARSLFEALVQFVVSDGWLDESFVNTSRDGFYPLPVDFEVLGAQEKVVAKLIKGLQIDEAIFFLNTKFNPIFLRFNPRVHFLLDQQKLIDMCGRKGDIGLEFSRIFANWADRRMSKDFDLEKESRWTKFCLLFKDGTDSYPVLSLISNYRRNSLIQYVVEEMRKFQNGKLEPEKDLSVIHMQKTVKALIKDLHFDEAIAYLNEKLTESFLRKNLWIHFLLEQQKMIEFCRNDNLIAAQEFSKVFVRWENVKSEEADFLDETCKTMSLTLLDNSETSPAAELMNLSRREYVEGAVLAEMTKFQTGTKAQQSMHNYLTRHCLKKMFGKVTSRLAIDDLPHYLVKKARKKANEESNKSGSKIMIWEKRIVKDFHDGLYFSYKDVQKEENENKKRLAEIENIRTRRLSDDADVDVLTMLKRQAKAK